MNRRQYAIVVSFLISLLAAALVALSGEQGSGYNPWLDYNNDGIIDVEDLHALGSAYGTSGTPLNQPMTLEYDSGWIDISDKRGQHFSITPGFNLETTTWFPRIYGKVAADTTLHQKYWYGYDMPGWNKTYGGTNYEESYSAVQTSDGGYAITGFTNSFGSGYQVYLVKTYADGTMAWNKTYGGTGEDRGWSVVETSDGGYAITGYTSSFGNGYQVYLVKTLADGTMAWNRTYGEWSSDYGCSVIQTSDGGYAITGSYQGLQVYLVKTDAAGTMEWQQTYGGSSVDWGWSVVQTSDGGYAVAGYTHAYGPGTPAYANVYLVKTDASGTMAWNKTYGEANEDYGWSVVQTSDGGYAIAGYTASYGANWQAYLVKTDASGTMIWYNTYGGASIDYGQSVVQTSDGGYAIAGYTHSYGPGTPANANVYLVKTDSAGTMQWNKAYGGTNEDRGQSIVQTSDGGYAIAGYTDTLDSSKQVYLVKTDAFGLTDLEWGVTVTNITADAMTFYRGTMDPYYNYVRVRLWVVKENP